MQRETEISWLANMLYLSTAKSYTKTKHKLVNREFRMNFNAVWIYLQIFISKLLPAK